MAIKSIKRINVSENVFEQMKQQLAENEWKPGEKLPSEGALAEMFGVSRVTIRNALQKLVVLGLIETKLGDGSYVRNSGIDSCMNSLMPTIYLEQNLQEIIEFRLVIETETAALAAQRVTEEDVKKLRMYIDRMEQAQNDYAKLAKIDYDFHYAIAEVTQNPLVIRSYSIVMEALSSAMVRIVERMSGEWGKISHPKIVDAIAAKDPESARNYMRSHIMRSFEYIDPK